MTHVERDGRVYRKIGRVKGPPGDPPTITMGQVAVGDVPNVALREVADNAYVVDVTLTRGAKGDPGDPGAPGQSVKGDTGAPGAGGLTPTFQIGNVTTLAAGATATAAVRSVGVAQYAVDLGLPAGAAGAAGTPGANGSAPTLEAGTITTLAAGASATAGVRLISGVRYAIDLGLPRGANGSNGNDGTNGTTPTLTNGTTTTLAAGAAATMNVRLVSGTTYAVDLGIPRGDAGTPGTNGTNGAAGASFNVGEPGDAISAPGPYLTSGTAFQPRASGPCALNVSATLVGTVSLASLITVSVGATQGGTFKSKNEFGASLSVLANKASSGDLLIPAGYWVKVTVVNAGVLSSITLNRVITPL